MTDIIQHIENEKQPFRVPVFTIKPVNVHFSDKVEKKASVVRLTTCDFVTNYYNISYTSNCLRWLRFPEYETNDLLTSNFNKAPENPYFKTNLNKTTTPLLCKLYITPGAYENIVDIMTEINDKLYDSFVDLFDIHTNPTRVYLNQQFKYQYSAVGTGGDASTPMTSNIPSLFTRHGIIELKNSVVSNSELSSLETGKIYYYIPGVFRYEQNNTSYTLRDCIICFENYSISGASLINATVDLPYFAKISKTAGVEKGNSFSVVYTTSQDYNVFDSTFSGTCYEVVEGYEEPYTNILCSGLIGDAENVRATVWSNGKEVISSSNGAIFINSASLMNYETVSGIGKFNDRFNYQVDEYNELGKYIYRYANGSSIINPDLTVSLLIPDVQLTTTGGGYYKLNFTPKSNLTILNTTGLDYIALDGYIAQAAPQLKYPNHTMLGGINDLPDIRFLYDGTEELPSQTVSLRIDLKGEYSDTSGSSITETSSRNETFTVWVDEETSGINKPEDGEILVEKVASMTDLTKIVKTATVEERITETKEDGRTVTNKITREIKDGDIPNTTTYTHDEVNLKCAVSLIESVFSSDQVYTRYDDVLDTRSTVAHNPMSITVQSDGMNNGKYNLSYSDENTGLSVTFKADNTNNPNKLDIEINNLPFDRTVGVNTWQFPGGQDIRLKNVEGGSDSQVYLFVSVSIANPTAQIPKYVATIRFTRPFISGSDSGDADVTVSSQNQKMTEIINVVGSTTTVTKEIECNFATTKPSFSIGSSISSYPSDDKFLVKFNGETKIEVLNTSGDKISEITTTTLTDGITINNFQVMMYQPTEELITYETAEVKATYSLADEITYLKTTISTGNGNEITLNNKYIISSVLQYIQFNRVYVSFDKEQDKKYYNLMITDGETTTLQPVKPNTAYVYKLETESSETALTVTKSYAVRVRKTKVDGMELNDVFGVDICPVWKEQQRMSYIEVYDEYYYERPKQPTDYDYIDKDSETISYDEETHEIKCKSNIISGMVVNGDDNTKVIISNSTHQSTYTKTIRPAKNTDSNGTTIDPNHVSSGSITIDETTYNLYHDTITVIKVVEDGWQLDLEAERLKFDKITTIINGTNETTFTGIDGTITRGDEDETGTTFKLNEYFLVDRKYKIDSGDCSAGIIKMSPLETETHPMYNLYQFTTASTDIKEVKTINNNLDLTYDTYYYLAYRMIMEKGAESQFVFLTTADENNKLGIKFFSPVIPITSDTIYTNTLNFLDVMQDPNFSLKRTTKHMEKLIEIDDLTHEFNLTTNNFKLSKYNNESANVDDYYYNFEIGKDDLWAKLGFAPPKIEFNRKNVVSHKETNKADESDTNDQVYPIYTVKGVYYSETLYKGTVKLQHPIKIEQYESASSTGIGAVRKIILPVGFDVLKFLSSGNSIDITSFNTYFNKTIHYGSRLMRLSIPKTIEVKMTQNKDIEEYLNSNEIVDSIANIGQYQVVRDNQTTVGSIQQELVINATIEIPEDKPLYVFLTNGNQIYSLMDTVASLNVEYIN